MTFRHHLRAELRWRAIGRLEAGQSQIEVTRWLNVSPSVIHRLWRQFQTTDSASRGFSLGRPTTTMSADDRDFSLCALRNRTATPNLLRSSFVATTGKLVSASTVSIEGFTKVMYMRGYRPFTCCSRHALGGTVCSGHDNTSTGRLINGGLFSLRMR